MIGYFRSTYSIYSYSRISYLEHELKKQKKINNELKKPWEELKNEIIELHKRIDIIEFNKLKNKIITAIQDINLIDNLENKFIHTYLICFTKLKDYNYNYHRYIDYCDDIIKINYKKKILLLQLLALNQDNIMNINIRFSTNKIYFYFIEEIIKYLKSNINNNLHISKDDIDDIDYWWTNYT